MKYKNVVWDWNGTLLNDVKVGVNTLNDMLGRRGLPLLSVEDYKELAEALVDHDESGSRAFYAERIHKNLSDYQPEDSSDSSSKSSSKEK